jgi:hypothetical protein
VETRAVPAPQVSPHRGGEKDAVEAVALTESVKPACTGPQPKSRMTVVELPDMSSIVCAVLSTLAAPMLKTAPSARFCSGGPVEKSAGPQIVPI